MQENTWQKGQSSQEAGAQWKSLQYVERNFPYLFFTFRLLVVQPKTHTVLLKVGFQHSVVWGEIQTIRLSSSTLRYLQKKTGWPWRTLRPQWWWSDPEAEK